MSAMYILGVVLCMAVGINSASIKYEQVEAATLADVISCQIDNAERDECMKAAITHILPKLHSGLQALNIPPLDPLVHNNTVINFQRGQILQATGLVKTARVYGLSRAQIKRLKSKISKENVEVEIEAYVPRVFLEGTYKGEGRFNLLKMSAKGHFNISASDITVITKVAGTFEERDGEQYLRVKKFDMAPSSIGNMKVHFTGLFPDEELTRVSNEFVNQYWPVLYKEMIQETREIWEPIFIREANKMTLSVPFRTFMYYSEDSA